MIVPEDLNDSEEAAQFIEWLKEQKRYPLVDREEAEVLYDIFCSTRKQEIRLGQPRG